MMDDQHEIQLWITPTAQEESRVLLQWDREREQLEFPVISRDFLHRLEDPLARQKLWGWTIADDFALAELPIARQFDAHKHISRLMYAAHGTPQDTMKGLADWEWVTVRDILMGFTPNGREVSQVVRQFLHRTGRSGTRWVADVEPLVLGVVGHRQLNTEEIPVLYDKVHQAVADVRSEFPNRTLEILTGLRPGAEQLLADVALELGLPVVAALPMGLAEYEREFPFESALHEFRQLLHRTQVWYTLPERPSEWTSSPPRSHQRRQQRLSALGRYIVDRSHVLLAIWDGQVKSPSGATAEALRYAFHLPRRPDQRLLIRHIPVPRR